MENKIRRSTKQSMITLHTLTFSTNTADHMKYLRGVSNNFFVDAQLFSYFFEITEQIMNYSW